MNTPGMMDTPCTAPSLSRAVRVVAVPMSITTAGRGHFSFTATALARISAPSWAGLSMHTCTPVSLSWRRITGSTGANSRTARSREWVRLGTTEEITAPSMDSDSTW